jgi:ATP synthase protein I
MKNVESMKGLGRYGTIGIEIVLSVLFGLFVGMKLDDWLGTKPWMTVVWFGFGCAAGGRAVYRSWKTMQVAAKREEAAEGNPAQAFPDEKSLAWQREEEKQARLARDRAEKPVEQGGESATNDPEEGGKSQ